MEKAEFFKNDALWTPKLKTMKSPKNPGELTLWELKFQNRCFPLAAILNFFVSRRKLTWVFWGFHSFGFRGSSSIIFEKISFLHFILRFSWLLLGYVIQSKWHTTSIYFDEHILFQIFVQGNSENVLFS